MPVTLHELIIKSLQDIELSLLFFAFAHAWLVLIFVVQTERARRVRIREFGHSPAVWRHVSGGWVAPLAPFFPINQFIQISAILGTVFQTGCMGDLLSRLVPAQTTTIVPLVPAIRTPTPHSALQIQPDPLVLIRGITSNSFPVVHLHVPRPAFQRVFSPTRSGLTVFTEYYMHIVV
jgi:hypothetical protein